MPVICWKIQCCIIDVPKLRLPPLSLNNSDITHQKQIKSGVWAANRIINSILLFF